MPVLILHIRPEGAKHYIARVFDGTSLVGTPTLHVHIESAIKAYGDSAIQGVNAFEIWYGGWSVGTVPLVRMRTEADDLAKRLLVLSAVLR